MTQKNSRFYLAGLDLLSHIVELVQKYSCLLYKYTKVSFVILFISFSLDNDIIMCYNVYRNKEQGRKPTDNLGGKHHDDYYIFSEVQR